jgi:hypothetical protein
MMLRVALQAGIIANTVRARYRCREFSLRYCHQPLEAPTPMTLATTIDEHLGIRRDKHFFAIADTLEIMFTGGQGELVAFDAYTNWHKWLRLSDIVLPTTSGAGRVCLLDTFDDDRIRLDAVPEYLYSERQRVLRISLATNDSAARYYRVSDNLIVGIDSDKLVGLLIHDLSIGDGCDGPGKKRG